VSRRGWPGFAAPIETRGWKIEIAGFPGTGMV